jgi:pyruvate/2-oxoacid:ferredoxin oxidoreductase beta subunit
MSQHTFENVATEELINSGHLACGGCGAVQALRLALKGLGENTIVTITACCWSIIDGMYPMSALKVPVYHTAFGTSGSLTAGVRAGLDMLGHEDVTVVAWSGDGGTFDIGFRDLSAAAERNENMIYMVYDNEAYMNTGIQRSSATPLGAWTNTTPVLANAPGKKHPKKPIMEIMADHRIPYAATVTPAYPDDFIRKLEKAKNIHGFRFIHIFAPCPTGWKFDESFSVKVGRLGVRTGVFPLYEVEHGEKYTINLLTENVPVEEYLKLQGRFIHLKEAEIQWIQENVDKELERLKRRAGIV